jgi:nitroreductase
METEPIAANGRTADYPIETLFLERWSPRAFTGEAIPPSELARILEAARWAPSCFNSQPWRFLYARRESPHWRTFLGLLNDFNQSWASNAAALIIVASRTTILRHGTESPSPSHSFDSGAAWALLALQAVRSGWHAHAMAGFDRERSAAALRIPANYCVEAAIAIGRAGPKTLLPGALAEREVPSMRRVLAEIAFEGGFPEGQEPV